MRFYLDNFILAEPDYVFETCSFVGLDATAVAGDDFEVDKMDVNLSKGD